MSNAVQVLARMASDASLINDKSIAVMLNNSDIAEEQKQAISSKDIDTLTETIHNLPVIKCVPLVVADDEDDGQVITIVNKTAVNF